MDQLFLLYKSQCVLNMLNQCIIIHIIQAFIIFPIAHDVGSNFFFPGKFHCLNEFTVTVVQQNIMCTYYRALTIHRIDLGNTKMLHCGTSMTGNSTKFVQLAMHIGIAGSGWVIVNPA